MKNMTGKTITLLPHAAQDAFAQFTAGNYKKAIDAYKILLKQSPSDALHFSLSEAYIKRAIELNKKGMLAEAIAMWENHSEHCTACQHFYLHINLLITNNQFKKAATAFIQHKKTLSETQQDTLEEMFAAISLGEKNEWSDLFPDDSLIKKHLPIAKQALQSWSDNNNQAMESSLSLLSYRSPYKYLKLLLKSCVHLKNNATTDAVSMIQKIPDTSVFYTTMQTAKCALSTPLELINTLPDYSPIEFNFVSAVRRFSDDQKRYLDKMRHIIKQHPTHKVMFDFIVNAQPWMQKSDARRLSYQLLPAGTQLIKPFEKSFGPLSVEEKAHIKTLSSVNKNNSDPANHWLEYAKMLDVSPNKNAYEKDIAILLRHVVTTVDQTHGPQCECQQSQNTIFLLERSLELDPNDKPTYLTLIQKFRKNEVILDAQRIIDKAIRHFPNDRDILTLAIETKRDQGLFQDALTYSQQLIALDPINPIAQLYLLEFQLMEFQVLLQKKKWLLAKDMLNALGSMITAPEGKLILQINEGICAFSRGDTTEAKKMLNDTLDKSILSRIKLLFEANKCRITFLDLEKKCDLVKTETLSFFNTFEFVSFLKYVEKYKSRVDFKKLFSVFKNPIEAILSSALTLNEITQICLVMHKIERYDWIKKLIASNVRYKKTSLCVYYSVLAKLKGDASQLSRRDYHSLIEALQRCKFEHDDAAGVLITRFLDAYESSRNDDDFDDDDDAEKQAFFEMLEDLSPKERKKLEKIFEQGGLF
ncbi:MAG: hypothetical protein A3F13_06735 [Gammaproteobacteria bacterium RIFCSPHIGHO2_12_FULL_40_19]|nr:MAG: hypothetical protein A3F13_06735 [Gammaproteobacteria bacterium RIFCSPHIGHO2_12_FULL_40_19]